MISSEVQRTLVKSPPELWAEISDPESLARHLGEFGEIRIIRVQPEQKVEWEADDASGTVVIKPSGWGTKVKLTVTRELTETDAEAEDTLARACTGPEQAEPTQRLEHEPELKLEHEPELEPELEHEPELEPELEHEPALDDEVAAAPYAAADLDEKDVGDEPARAATLEPESTTEPEPEPRRGFFARLFGRRRSRAQEASTVSLIEHEPESEQPSDEAGSPEHDSGFEQELGLAPEQATVVSEQPTDEPLETVGDPLDERPADITSAADEQQLAAPEASASAADEPVQPDDTSARTKLAEEIAAEEVTAVLTGVLDRLGAAHHRPFSRA